MNERYREIRQRKPEHGDEGLPQGARKFNHPAVDEVLEDLNIREIESYQDLHVAPGLTTDTEPGKIYGLEAYEHEISNDRSETFRHQQHPQVEGYAWSKGISFKVEAGRVFLFVAMQPWTEGGSPDPIVYVDGNVGAEEVLGVVTAYAQARQRAMTELETQLVS